MAQTADIPTAGVDEVRRLCGDEPEWKVQAILDSGATVADVEAALAWASGQDELEDREALSGLAGEVYEILMADAAPEDDR